MRRGSEQTQRGRMRIDRPLACLLLGSLAMAGAVAVDATPLYFVAVVAFPGLIAGSLTRGPEWVSLYAVNSIAAAIGATVVATARVAMSDPTQLDSDPRVLALMAFIFVDFAGVVGAAAIAPFWWVVRRWLGVS